MDLDARDPGSVIGFVVIGVAMAWLAGFVTGMMLGKWLDRGEPQRPTESD